MVTHNMQQAARISDNTAFFLLGEVVEYDNTGAAVLHSERQKNRGLYYGEVWLSYGTQSYLMLSWSN